jgi:hypothetical protein
LRHSTKTSPAATARCPPARRSPARPNVPPARAAPLPAQWRGVARLSRHSSRPSSPRRPPRAAGAPPRQRTHTGSGERCDLGAVRAEVAVVALLRGSAEHLVDGGEHLGAHCAACDRRPARHRRGLRSRTGAPQQTRGAPHVGNDRCSAWGRRR